MPLLLILFSSLSLLMFSSLSLFQELRLYSEPQAESL